tara:strand:+ start:401 stop:610 length:210 start_codon:yes stop_codon:yes gene_type:complete
MKHYFEAIMENTVPFLLAWEAYVLFMLIFFISIVIRINRMENKLDTLLEINGYLDYKEDEVPKRKEVLF